VRISCFSAVTANLFFVTTPCQIAHPHSGPAQFGHDFRQASVGTRAPRALWDFKQIQQRLRGDTFQTIEDVDLAAHALKREAPRIGYFCRRSFSLFFSQPTPNRQRSHDPPVRTNQTASRLGSAPAFLCLISLPRREPAEMLQAFKFSRWEASFQFGVLFKGKMS